MPVSEPVPDPVSVRASLAPAVPRGVLVLGGLAASFIVIGGLRAAAGLVGPVFLALVLTILVHPVRRWLARARVPGWLASLICILAVYAILIGLSLALVAATARFATLLPTYQAKFDDLLGNVGEWLADLGIDQSQVKELLGAIDFGQFAGFVGGLLGGILGVLSNLVFILTLVLFLTVDASTFPGLLARAGETRGPLVSALVRFADGTRAYLFVSTVFGAVVAVIDTIALQIIGVPVPLLWGLLAFITNYVPNIGFVIGLVPPAILGLLEGGWSMCLAVIVVYSLINVIIQTVIQPRFVGDAVGLSTTLTFLSLVFWSWTLGAIGALLAIPLSLLAKALLVDVDPRTRWLTPLISNKAVPGDEPGPVEP